MSEISSLSTGIATGHTLLYRCIATQVSEISSLSTGIATRDR